MCKNNKYWQKKIKCADEHLYINLKFAYQRTELYYRMYHKDTLKKL